MCVSCKTSRNMFGNHCFHKRQYWKTMAAGELHLLFWAALPIQTPLENTGTFICAVQQKVAHAHQSDFTYQSCSVAGGPQRASHRSPRTAAAAFTGIYQFPSIRGTGHHTRSERSHPNTTLLSAGLLKRLSAAIKASGSNMRKASLTTGGFWVVRMWWFMGLVSICPAPHLTSDYYNIQITVHWKLIGLINIQVNDDTVNTFH